VAQAALGEARAAFREKSGKGKFSGTVLPAHAQQPIVLRRERNDDINFFGRDDDDRAKIGVESPDARLREIEIHGARRGILRRERAASQASAIEDEIGAKLLDGFGGAAILSNRGKEHGEQEKHETNRSESPGVPETQWKHNEAGSNDAQSDAKGRPGTGSGAKREEFGERAGNLEEGIGGGVAEARESGDGFGGRQVAGKKWRMSVVVHVGRGSLC